MALEVVEFVRSQGVRVRFSTEDSFRSDVRDLFRIYEAVDRIGVHRVGIADTVGVATPRQVYELVRELRGRVAATSSSTGTTTRLRHRQRVRGARRRRDARRYDGAGDRRAQRHHAARRADRPALRHRSRVRRQVRSALLRTIDTTVAQMVGVDVPFNNYITGITAFTHKAGIHAKAILNNPETYEIIDPQAFGLTRYISIAHRLTGWNAGPT
jgi:homocitrate synthase